MTESIYELLSELDILYQDDRIEFEDYSRLHGMACSIEGQADQLLERLDKIKELVK